MVQKDKGNIIRITDLYKDYNNKSRENITPIGFAVGKNTLYLTSNNGKMVVVDLRFGNIIKEIKFSGKLVSEPLIFNEKLFLVRNGSIIRYN
mgnify:FL=1